MINVPGTQVEHTTGNEGTSESVQRKLSHELEKERFMKQVMTLSHHQLFL